jgi:hypothetical protein
MIVSSPYRSAMRWACHGVPPLPRSGNEGTDHLDQDEQCAPGEEHRDGGVCEQQCDPSDLRDSDGEPIGLAGLTPRLILSIGRSHR